jgi:hypothetical protein
MNIKKNRLGFMALVISSVMVLSACNGAGGNADYTQEEMEAKIVAAFEAMEEVDTVRSNLFMDGTVGVESEFIDEVEVSFDIDMGIGQEILDRDEMLFNMDFELAGNVTYDETNVGFSMGLVVLQDAVYAQLGSITGLENEPNAAMFLPMLEGYMNKWWKFELPEGGLAGLGLPQDTDIVSQQEELLAILKNADFFESIEFLGTDKVAGNSVEAFDVVLSEKGILEYVREVTAITDPGMEIRDEDVEAVKEVIGGLELDTVVWVTNDGYLAGMSMEVTGTVEDEYETADIDAKIVVEYTDFNKNINIEAPEESTLFDLGSLGIDPGVMSAGSQIEQANNAQRNSDVNVLLNAIHQYSIDNRGDLPAAISSTPADIGDRVGEADICEDLVPTYLAALPTDPTDSVASFYDCGSSYNTGYTVMADATGRVTVSAPSAEAGDVISVTR